jgi:uncharacterized beta-barrel protein YwiB (DUF1934 family)
MTKDVLITIEGLQHGSEEAPVTTTAYGTYHLTNGWHYITYDDISTEGEAATKNTIKIKLDQIILTKKGTQLTQMNFELKETTQANYQTPYGSLTLEIKTTKILIMASEENIEVKLDYSLSTEDSPLSDNSLTIQIQKFKKA